MAFYSNTNSTSSIAAVEFSPRPGGNLAFFYTKSLAAAEHLKPQLRDLGQEILGETSTKDRAVLVTQGNSAQVDLMRALEQRGVALTLPEPKRVFHPWKWRGNFSDIGQGLTLTSAIRSGKLDGQKIAFAGLNLSANMINKIYGAQKGEDTHRLHFLKTTLNSKLLPYLPDGATLPAADESRADLRKEPSQPLSLGEKFNGFMRSNSVRVGEIGLRYLGAVAMVLSIPQLKKMGEVWKEVPVVKDGIPALVDGKAKVAEKIVEKFNWGRAWAAMSKQPAGKVFGLLSENKTNLWTGAIYLAGKSVGLVFAKTPDPFDPKPKTGYDKFREKYAFRLSSLIETGAAATLAIGSFRKKDYIGGAGGLALTSGLLVRLFAPFGVRVVNKEELYSHVTDSLAVMPRKEIPQLLSKTTAFLKENLRDWPDTYGQIFVELKDKLYHDHGIALDTVSPSLEPTQVAGASRSAVVAQSRKLAAPHTTFVDRHTQQVSPTTFGIG